MRLLVVGAYGMLGREVVAAASAAGHTVIERDVDSIDIVDPEFTTRVVAGDAPDVVINCAAFTDVDGAEDQEDVALEVNGDGAGNLAAAAAAAGARIIHISTDYVFPGDATEPYVESDATGPRTAYGRTKLAGERAVAHANPNHAIARTSWLFGVHGKNFVDTILRLAATRESIQVVDDQEGCPTWAGHLAPALITLAESGATGIFHAGGGGRCTWFDLATAAVEATGSTCRVEPTTSDAFPSPTPRPAMSVLVSERGADAVELPPWQEGLAGFLAERPTPGTDITTTGDQR
jgi:dTDP-4-dehydrorhamnose reductase